MTADRKPLQIGPFAGGLNLYDDPTAIQDTECIEALNFEPGLDGSLMSRPPFQDLGQPVPLGATGQATPLGVFYAENGVFYLLATDGLSSTYYYSAGAWTLITNTMAAASFTQFDGKAWLVSPIGEADPGGYWTPAGGFVADTDMPRGDVILSYNFRLWIARGKNATQGTRVYYSKVLGQPSFWAAAAFIDVGAGDGQSIVALSVYYNSLVVFRTRSIYTIQYLTDPAQATVQVLVPGVGLENKYCVVSDENYIYFFYDGNAYQFINNQVQQINVKVPFEARDRSNIHMPLAVSVFGKRILYSFYDTIFLFSLRTRTWTRWRSAQHGAIGKIVSPVSPNTADAAYALSSRLVGAESVRTNVVNEPSGTIIPGTVTAIGAGSAISSFNGYATSTNSTTGLAPGAFGLKIQTLTVGTDLVANTQYTYSVEVLSTYTVLPTVGRKTLLTVAGSGVAVSGAQTFDAVDALTRRTITFKTGASGTVDLQVLNGEATPAFASTNRVSFYHVNVELASTFNPDEPYFDGGWIDTYQTRYDWVGTAYASKSTRTSLRYAPLLFIREDTTGIVEHFDCILQTKNYNYALPSNFKRLFWWGVDAIFRGAIKGEAIPIVYASKPTWGQIRTQGITWNQMLSGTWGSPLSVPISIVTDQNLSNLGPTRKFVKFRKGLRFRQIGFRVTFPVDGTTLTLPVYIFSLTAHIVTRETVVKAIS